MPCAMWNDTYRIGLPKVDAQHQALFDAVNAFFDAAQAGTAKDEVSRLLDFLLTYTEVHFRDEETLMTKIAYPGLDLHRRKHVALLKDVGKYKEAFATGKPLSLLEVSNFIADWLKQHILHDDRAVATFILKKGLAV